RAAAPAAARELGVALDAHVVGGPDLADPGGCFPGAYGISPSGAVLVRPDGFVGWRAADAAAAPEHALRQAPWTPLWPGGSTAATCPAPGGERGPAGATGGPRARARLPPPPAVPEARPRAVRGRPAGGGGVQGDRGPGRRPGDRHAGGGGPRRRHRRGAA